MVLLPAPASCKQANIHHRGQHCILRSAYPQVGRHHMSQRQQVGDARWLHATPVMPALGLSWYPLTVLESCWLTGIDMGTKSGLSKELKCRHHLSYVAPPNSAFSTDMLKANGVAMSLVWQVRLRGGVLNHLE